MHFVKHVIATRARNFPEGMRSKEHFFNLFDDCPHAERHIQGQQVEPLRHAKPRLSINEWLHTCTWLEDLSNGHTWTTEEPKIFGSTNSWPKNWFYQKPKTENQFFLDFPLCELVVWRIWCSVAFRLINWYSVAFRLINWFSVAFRLLVFQRKSACMGWAMFFGYPFFGFPFLIWFSVFGFLSLCTGKTVFAFQDNLYIYISINKYIYIYMCVCIYIYIIIYMSFCRLAW